MNKKDGQLAPVVVFYGTDVSALYAARSQYVSPKDDADVIRLERPTAAEIMRHIETMDLFSSARRIEAVNPLCLITAFEDRESFERLIAKLQNLPRETRVFIIVEGNLDRRKRNTKVLLKSAVAHQADLLTRRQLMQAFDAELRLRKGRLEPSARTYLQQMTERWENVSSVFVATEIERWLLSSPERTITESMIRDSLPSYMQHRAFAFWDDFLNGNLEAVLIANDSLFDGAKEELKNVGYVASQLRLYLQIAEMERSGLKSSAIAERLGINNSWRWNSLEQARRKLSLRRTRALLLAVYECQYAQRRGITGQSMRDVWIRYIDR